jgi:hypothetical protein
MAGWTAIWAKPADLERGVFFVKEDGEGELVDVWGGVAVPEERSAVTKWALERRVPAELAACFAAAISGR